MRLRYIFLSGLLFAELMLPLTSAAQPWNEIAQFNGMGRVSACYFFNESTGIIGFDRVTNGSPLLRTTDGGTTWQSVTTPIVTERWVCDIWFRDSLEGWATFLNTSSGFLWHSTDGGISWSQVSLYDEFSGVRATSKAIVVTGLDNVGVFISTDGGSTFPLTYGANQNGVDFVDNLHGAVSGYNHYAGFAYTGDGGLTWQPSAGPNDEVWGICGLRGTSTFIASAEIDGQILRSTDFGVSWNITNPFLGVNGAISGANGAIYVQADGVYSSLDTGITWTNIGGPSNGTDCRIAAFQCTIYAFDNSGGVWKISSGQPFAINTTPLNFGTLVPCETHDTTISFVNTECNPITITGWTLSQQTEGYNVAGIGSQSPISLAPGDTASLRIYIDGTHPGTLYDTILVTVNASSNSTWRIPIQTFIPAVDSVRFTLETQASLIPRHYYAVNVLPDRVVNASKGLTSVSGRLSYFDNDFAFDSITAAAGLQFKKSGPFRNNGVDDVVFSLSNANGIALDPETPIVQLWLESALTDSVDYFIGLDSLLLNGGDPAFSNCTLATTSTGTSPQLGFACGDSVLIDAMLDRNLFYASPPIPNPLGANGEGDVAQISLQAFADGEATIEIYDALGRSIHNESYSLHNGQIILCPIDLRGSPVGSYFYSIRFLSAFGKAMQAGSIILIQ